MLQPLRAGAGAANVMPDDKSSDEFFMKNREKGKRKEGRKEECRRRRLFRDKNHSRDTEAVPL